MMSFIGYTERVPRGGEITMHVELWAGVVLKVTNADFFLEQMGRSLQPPERTAINVALQSAGTIIGTQWQRAFYAHLDAFLAMGRSVPEVIKCCFGKDTSPPMRGWFKGLAAAEQKRRRMFSTQFEPDYAAFRNLPLSTARNITMHRTGFPPVEVTISGRFGVSYTGSPVQRVPDIETRSIVPSDDPADPAILLALAAARSPVPVQPMWTDFTIADRPLFPECQAYLRHAQNLVEHARGIAQQVHGGDSLTPPPS
jgi:hypothetical protein